jgi:hypothetical protein
MNRQLGAVVAGYAGGEGGQRRSRGGKLRLLQTGTPAVAVQLEFESES